MMRTIPYVDIIIVTYNGDKYLSRCFESLFALDYPKEKLKIVVVDNASTDKTCEIIKKYKTITFIQNSKNLGFARANNIALMKSTAKYALLLNQDSWLKPDYLSQLVQSMELHKNRAVCGGAEHPYEKELPLKGTTTKVIWVGLGATLLRIDAIRKINFLDTIYFMYWEDVDLCWRCIFNGWEIWYNPHAVWHHEGWRRKVSISDQRVINSTISQLYLLLKFGSITYIIHTVQKFFQKKKKVSLQKIGSAQNKKINVNRMILQFIYLLPKVLIARYFLRHYSFFNQKKADIFLKNIFIE